MSNPSGPYFDARRQNQIVQKAIDSALSKIARDTALKLFSSNPQGWISADGLLGESIIEYLQETKESKKSSDNPYVMVTLNFRPDANVVHAVALLRSLSKKWIYRWASVVEFHTEHGNHPHVHIFIEKEAQYLDKRKSQIIDEFYSTFKAFMSDKQKVDVRFHLRDTEGLSYIYGTKSDPQKQKFCELDIEWRKQLGIPPVLGTWPMERENPGLVSAPPQPPTPFVPHRVMPPDIRSAQPVVSHLKSSSESLPSDQDEYEN